jgi:hypothetical protein
MTRNLGDLITPSEANGIKQDIGSRVRWGGNTAVGDEVKPAYKSVYQSLRKAVHEAVPESAKIDDELTDHFAAKDSLMKLSKAEETGRGAGIMRGKIGNSLVGLAESAAGRALPVARAGAGAALPTLARGGLFLGSLNQ